MREFESRTNRVAAKFAHYRVDSGGIPDLSVAKLRIKLRFKGTARKELDLRRRDTANHNPHVLF